MSRIGHRLHPYPGEDVGNGGKVGVEFSTAEERLYLCVGKLAHRHRESPYTQVIGWEADRDTTVFEVRAA